MGPIHRDFDAASANEDEVSDAILTVKSQSGYVMEPHTACGWVAAEKTASGRRSPCIVLSTAHPAKFPDAMLAITGEHPHLPPRLPSLLTEPEHFEVLENDLAAVEAFVAASARG